MSFFAQVRFRLQARRHHRRLRAIHARYADYTMIPPAAYVANLQLAERVAHLPGCVVECGVWRGGMSAGLVSILGRRRRYFLFDSFEGLPPAAPVDGAAAMAWQKNTTGKEYHDNCTAPPEFADRAMRLAGAETYELKKGWFNETVPPFRAPEPIALLRLDGDWYDSTMVCLDHLFSQVCTDGLIILDDYHALDGCSRALHDFLSKRSATERISSFSHVCYLQKRPAASSSPEHNVSA
jgi:O-methyltransferase